MVIPERRAAGITGTVVKASAGASEHLSVARVVNIARTLDELKEQNVWVVGLDERGDKSYDELDYNMNCAIVMGAEGKGLHDLVRRKCDMLVSIPMMGAVSSLNVSVAGGIVMYEVQRQRRQAQKPAAKKSAQEAERGVVLRRLALAVLFVVPLAALPARPWTATPFSFTRYDLEATVDPHQHGLAVEGTVELRNVSRRRSVKSRCRFQARCTGSRCTWRTAPRWSGWSRATPATSTTPEC